MYAGEILLTRVRGVDEKGPRWWEIQNRPESEELGARSEKQRQAQPTAESFAPAPARQTRWHVSGVATMTGKQLWIKKAWLRYLPLTHRTFSKQ
jgi:hypothetical protein